MRKYRRTPVVVQAVRWFANVKEICALLGERYGTDWKYAGPCDTAILIPSPVGEQRAEMGDWLVKDPQGVVSVQKPAAFLGSHEEMV